MYIIKDDLRIISGKNIFSKSSDVTEKGHILFQHLLVKGNSEKSLHAQKDKSLLKFFWIKIRKIIQRKLKSSGLGHKKRISIPTDVPQNPKLRESMITFYCTVTHAITVYRSHSINVSYLLHFLLLCLHRTTVEADVRNVCIHTTNN